RPCVRAATIRACRRESSRRDSRDGHPSRIATARRGPAHCARRPASRTPWAARTRAGTRVERVRRRSTGGGPGSRKRCTRTLFGRASRSFYARRVARRRRRARVARRSRRARDGTIALPFRGQGESTMTTPTLPPLTSSDGHLEVRPERWTPRMPAKLRDRAPRTIKLPDGGDAIVVEGQPPYPAPFLDLRAGRTNETWQPFGATVDDTAGVGPPEQRLKEQDMDHLHAEVLFPNMQVGPRLWRGIADDDLYRAVVRAYNDWLAEEYCPISRDRLIGLGVIPWTNLDDAIAELRHCA